MSIKKILRNIIIRSKLFYWSFFHPDNLLSFKYANKAEKIGWEFVIKEMSSYKTICELGCVNGRVIFILREFLKNKIYIGYDLNIFAIMVAKILNYFFGKSKNSFHCKNALFSANEDCELFISIATLIYFSENELRKFIRLLKCNKSFKAIMMHEIFINDKAINSKDLISGNSNIHSIAMIEKEFGKGYKVDIYRTFYSIWEKDDRISAILSIKKI